MMQNDPNGAAAEGMPSTHSINDLPSDVAPLTATSPVVIDERTREDLHRYLDHNDRDALRKAFHSGRKAIRLNTIMTKAAALATLITGNDPADGALVVDGALSLCRDVMSMNGQRLSHIALPVIPDGPDREVAYAYLQWLHMEKRLLAAQLFPNCAEGENAIPGGTAAQSFHFPPDRAWHDAPMPSTRAEMVMRFVGVDLDGRAAA